MILLKAGGITGLNFNGELWYDDYNPSNYSPYPASALGQAAVWTAYWLQKLPFSGLVSNGNALAYSFGSGTGKVTFAWTYEGTTQSVTAAGYSGVVNLDSTVQGSISALNSNVTVLLGNGTLTFH
jgi:hypothetical protein